MWIDMMQRLGLDVMVIDRPWGEGADEAILQDILSKDKDKKIKAVAVVHNETTTGAGCYSCCCVGLVEGVCVQYCHRQQLSLGRLG